MAKADLARPYGTKLKNPVTIKRAPDWLCNGDVIEKRGNQYFAVSLHVHERRWRVLLHRIKFG